MQLLTSLRVSPSLGYTSFLYITGNQYNGIYLTLHCCAALIIDDSLSSSCQKQPVKYTVLHFFLQYFVRRTMAERNSFLSLTFSPYYCHITSPYIIFKKTINIHCKVALPIGDINGNYSCSLIIFLKPLFQNMTKIVLLTTCSHSPIRFPSYRIPSPMLCDRVTETYYMMFPAVLYAYNRILYCISVIERG